MESAQRTDRNWAKWVRIIGTLVSLGLLILLLSRQDLGELVRIASGIPAGALAAGLGLLTVRVIAHTYRWSALLRGQRIVFRFRELLGLQYGSFFASNFLPTTVGGDVIRLVGILRETTNKVGGAASIVVDRAMGVFAMMFVLPLSWPILSGAASGATLGLTVGRVALPESVRSAGRRAWEATELWLKTPGSLMLALLAAWIGILVYLLFIWILALGLGIDVTLAEVAGVTSITYFVALVPFTINAYGLREITVIALYSSLGASTEQAAALALLSRALILISSLPGAVTVWGSLFGERVGDG